MTRAWQMRVPPDAAHVVVDTPAAVPAQEMPEMTKSADAIIVPVLPSDIDIHACSKCIADLLLIAKVRRDENRIGVVANRVKRNTVIYQSLMRFLETLRIPVIATLRDSQNYVRAAEQGVGSVRNEALRSWSRTLRIGSRCLRGSRPRKVCGVPSAGHQSSARDGLSAARAPGLFLLFPGTADFLRPVLVAVPVVEVVGDRAVAAAGLVNLAAARHRFECARLRARSPAVHSGVSSRIFKFAHRLCLCPCARQ